MERFQENIFRHVALAYHAIRIGYRSEDASEKVPLKLVKSDWLNNGIVVKHPPFTDDLIVDTLSSLEQSSLTSQESFSKFCKFHPQNREMYSDALKTQVYKTALAIRSALPASEQNNLYIDQLHCLLFDSAFSLLPE